jgi:hypothetical protein
MDTPSKEDLQQVLQNISDLIDEHGKERKNNVEQVFEQIGEHFATAPASSKLQYHNAFAGGLMLHTYDVVKTMYELNNPVYGCDEESILIVGLFHDLGKIGGFNEDLSEIIPMYTPIDSSNWRYKNGDRYIYNENLDDCLTHSLRSIRLLTQMNFPLTNDEFVSIFSHDGYFEEQNRSFTLMRCPYRLLKLLQASDQICTITEKKG